MDKLYFYSKSADKYPGKGINEFVSNPNEYSELSKIKDWRKVLSNFHIEPFYYGGYHYNTIEHAFQAAKISLVDKDLAYSFTLESNSALGNGDGLLARRSRKIAKLNKYDLRKWDSTKERTMYVIALEKYKNSKIGKDVLIKTKNAELWHIVCTGQPKRFTHLERIRQIFSK